LEIELTVFRFQSRIEDVRGDLAFRFSLDIRKGLVGS
jgi:hypothetical protein